MIANKITTLTELRKLYPQVTVVIDEDSEITVSENYDALDILPGVEDDEDSDAESVEEAILQQIIHPTISRMKIEAPIRCEVLREWLDDHLECYVIGVMFANDPETYLVALWWCDPTYLLTLGRSVNSLKYSKKFVDQISFN